jgi:glucose/arabinose dehydrogenase
MSRRASAMLAVLLAVGLGACADWASVPLSAGTGPNPALPPPAQRWFPTVNIAPAVGWMPGAVPQPAPGLRVNAFARDLDHPRWLLVLPNGDVLVAESNAPARTDRSAGIRQWLSGLMMKIAGAGVPSANRITLLRDTDHDGVADLRTVLLEGLNSPFGMALVEDQLYVANTDAVLRFPYVTGQTRIELPGVKLADLPAGPINHHWTKNLIVDPAGDQLYVTVGSNSNVAERGMALEEQRAAIWAIDRRSGRHRIFASGLRNPNGLAWEPQTRTLWTVVNERDELGSDLVPDYLTSVRDGDSFGWPHTYFGSHVDVRVTSPPPAGQAAAQGTSARNRKAAKITRCTAPCITFVRPDARVIEPTRKVSASSTMSLAPGPAPAAGRAPPTHHHRGDRQPDAGQRRADRQVHAGLQAVGARGAHRGPGLRQQHQHGDHDADHDRLGALQPRPPPLDERRQLLGQAHHATSATSSSPGWPGLPAVGGGACTSCRHPRRRRQEVVAVPHRLHEHEHRPQRQRRSPTNTSCDRV